MDNNTKENILTIDMYKVLRNLAVNLWERVTHDGNSPRENRCAQPPPSRPRLGFTFLPHKYKKHRSENGRMRYRRSSVEKFN